MRGVTEFVFDTVDKRFRFLYGKSRRGRGDETRVGDTNLRAGLLRRYRVALVVVYQENDGALINVSEEEYINAVQC